MTLTTQNSTGNEFKVGDIVLTNVDGYKYWHPVKISEVLENLYFVTSFTGIQQYVSAENVRKLEVCPGSLVVYLDSKSNAYSPGLAQDVKLDGVAIASSGGDLKWLPRPVVFPNTVDAGAKIVKRKGNTLDQVGTISQITPFGIRIQEKDGFDFKWSENEYGKTIGISPENVSPRASSKMPKAYHHDDFWTPAVVMFFLLMILFVPFMFVPLAWYWKLLGVIISGVIFTLLGKKICRSESPLLFDDYIGVMIAAIVAIVLISFIFRSGFFVKLWGAIFYSFIAASAYYGGMRIEPSKFKLPVKDENPDDTILDFNRQYKKGERVFCIPPNEQFMQIGRIRSRVNDSWEIELMSGELRTIHIKKVYPYECESGQRVLAYQPSQKAYLPAIVTRLEYDTLNVRFDDWTERTCNLDEVWFTVEKEMIGMTLRESEEMFTLVDQAAAEAEAACSQGKPDKALHILDKALKRYPFMRMLHLYKAFTYQVTGNKAMVAKEAEAAVGSISSEHAAYTVLGNAYLDLKQYGAAEQAFWAALNLNPDESGHWQNIGNFMLHLNKKEESEKYFTEAKRRGFDEQYGG